MARKRRSSSSNSFDTEAGKTLRFWIGFGATLAFIILGVAIWNKDRWSGNTDNMGTARIKPVPPSEVTRLKQEAIELSSRLNEQKTTVRVERLQRQMDIFRTILVSSKEPVEIEFSKLGFINAYSGLFAINESRGLELNFVDDDTESLMDKFRKDESAKVRRAAYRAQLQEPMIRLGTQDVSNDLIKNIEGLIDEIAPKFLNDWLFIQDIAPMCDIYKLKPEKASANAQIIRHIVQAWKETTDPNIKAFMATMLDEAKLIESDYYTHFLKVPAQDESAGEALIDALPAILSQNLGATGVDRVLTAGEQFEMNEWIAGARTIFTAVLDHLGKNNVPRSDELRTKAEYGLQRIGLLGKTFVYSAIDIKGKTHSTEDLIGRTTLVIFLDKIEDVNLVQPFKTRLVTMGKFGFHCHIVVLNDVAGRYFELMQEMDQSFSFFVDSKASSDFFKKCPISAAPYMFIIDKQGKVIDVNVSFSRLMDVVEKTTFGSIGN